MKGNPVADDLIVTAGFHLSPSDVRLFLNHEEPWMKTIVTACFYGNRFRLKDRGKDRKIIKMSFYPVRCLAW